MVDFETLIKYFLIFIFLITLSSSTLVCLELGARTLTARDLQSMLHVPLASLISLGTAQVFNHASRVVDLMPLGLIAEVEMAVLGDYKSFLLKTMSNWTSI